MKEAIGKLDLIEIKIKKFKCFCSAKDIKKIKRKVTDWENIFTRHMYDKGLVFKIHKELCKLNDKKINSPIKKKKGQRPKQTFHQKRVHRWQINI